jgi:hypothetical protein
MRLRWAERVVARVDVAADWARGAAALVVAREIVVCGQPLPERASTFATHLLGAPAVAARSLPELHGALPRRLAWALSNVDSPDDLWLAEAAWWRRVRADASSMMARVGPDRVVAAAVLLAADAWLTRAALQAAAQGDPGREAFDAVA